MSYGFQSLEYQHILVAKERLGQNKEHSNFRFGIWEDFNTNSDINWTKSILEI